MLSILLRGGESALNPDLRLLQINGLLSSPPFGNSVMLARHRPNQKQTPVNSARKRNRLTHFLTELKRREVFKVTGLYLVAAWGLSAGASEILPTVGLPEWSVRYLVIALFAATPVVALLAWLYEFSNRGIERDFGPAKLAEQDTILAHPGGIPVLTARWQNQERRFSASFDIGRDEACGMQLLDPMISRRHARIEFLNGVWQLRDLGSANGTEVNGKKVDLMDLQAGVSIVFYPGGAPLVIDIAVLESSVSTVVAPATN